MATCVCNTRGVTGHTPACPWLDQPYLSHLNCCSFRTPSWPTVISITLVTLSSFSWLAFICRGRVRMQSRTKWAFSQTKYGVVCNAFQLCISIAFRGQLLTRPQDGMKVSPQRSLLPDVSCRYQYVSLRIKRRKNTRVRVRHIIIQYVYFFSHNYVYQTSCCTHLHQSLHDIEGQNLQHCT